MPIPNASIGPNEVESNPRRFTSISTIDTPTRSNLPHGCPSQPLSVPSLKQNYIDLCS